VRQLGYFPIPLARTTAAMGRCITTHGGGVAGRARAPDPGRFAGPGTPCWVTA